MIVRSVSGFRDPRELRRGESSWRAGSIVAGRGAGSALASAKEKTFLISSFDGAESRIRVFFSLVSGRRCSTRAVRTCVRYTRERSATAICDGAVH